MTTPEALVTIRAFLAAKPMLSPDIRAALEQLLTAVEEAERHLRQSESLLTESQVKTLASLNWPSGRAKYGSAGR